MTPTNANAIADTHIARVTWLPVLNYKEHRTRTFVIYLAEAEMSAFPSAKEKGNNQNKLGFNCDCPVINAAQIQADTRANLKNFKKRQHGVLVD